MCRTSYVSYEIIKLFLLLLHSYFIIFTALPDDPAQEGLTTHKFLSSNSNQMAEIFKFFFII